MPPTLPFVASGTTEAQKNTELAVYLLRDLERKRHPQERIWPGERGMRTLQYACQVVEALYELNLRGLTNHLAEPAANWLVALPVDAPADDLRPYRLYPSRLKVLAQVGKFDPARLMSDFEALDQHFDPATGWLRDAPIDLHPTLVSLIWLDTLAQLDAHSLLPPDARARGDQTLAALNTAFDAWAALAASAQAVLSPAAPEQAGLRPGDLTNVGDASYAFELLGRYGQMKLDSERAEQARLLFLAALRAAPGASGRRSDRLYIGIHLQQRYPQQAEVRAAVQGLLAEIRLRYESDDCQREPISYHALVLRLIIAHHGEALRTGLLEKLWQDSLASVEAEQRQEQALLEAEFASLIRQTIRVQLTPPQRLTGTSARGEVFRVRFGLTTESTDEHGTPLSTPRDTLRLIVKKGPPEVLARAIQRYGELPEPLQRLFARHTPLEGHAPGYLIMQDLADMQPLSEVLGQLDRPVILADEKGRIAGQVAEAVSTVLHGLHGSERRPSILGHQLDVVYLAPMADALERLAQPQAFPELKQWLGGPLTANRRRYRPLDWYLHQLRRYEAQLNPPSLGFVHGDCHSRNLMLSRDLATCRFVDIETLTGAEDYVVDYGLLLEDVALYQSLPYGSERGRMEWDEIQTTRPANPARTLDNYIAYPPFPRSEAVLAFQTALLGRLRAYAESIGDAGWQQRLWLAIARGLLLLASRQLTSHTVEPHRKSRGPRYVNDTKLVQVAYAEALRLLRELTEHLSVRKAAPLPELPFPGEHRAPAAAAPAPVAALITALGASLGDRAERRAVAERPYLTDYVTRSGQRLIARVHTQAAAPVLYLAARPDQLIDPQGLAAPLTAEDAAVAAPGLGSRVALAALNGGLPPLLDLVRQAQQLADLAG